MNLERGLRYFLLMAVAVLTIILQSCYSRPTNADLKPVPVTTGSNDSYKIDTIFVSTNREKERGSGPYFNKKRNDKIHYAKFNISVPENKNHDIYRFDTKGRGRLNPEKHFFVTSSHLLDDEAMFRKQLEEQIQNNTQSKKVWIYVHGVYTHFAEGVFFISQLNRDNNLEGTPLLFTWPAGGKWLDYVYDKDSAATSRDALERTIQIASESGAEEVFILAHSLGCHLTMETLRQAAIDEDATFNGKLKCVLLASPDISVEVFESQLKRLDAKPSRPRIGVLLSHDDKMLKISKYIARGGERLGRENNDKLTEELGIDVFDLTGFSLHGASPHYMFAALPSPLEKIYQKMLSNQISGKEATTYPLPTDGHYIFKSHDDKNLIQQFFNKLFSDGSDPTEATNGPQAPVHALTPEPTP